MPGCRMPGSQSIAVRGEGRQARDRSTRRGSASGEPERSRCGSDRVGGGGGPNEPAPASRQVEGSGARGQPGDQGGQSSLTARTPPRWTYRARPTAPDLPPHRIRRRMRRTWHGSPGRTRPRSQGRAALARARPAAPSRAAPSQPGPGRATPSRAAPGRAGPSRAAPGRAAPGRAAPGRAEPGRAKPRRRRAGPGGPGGEPRPGRAGRAATGRAMAGAGAPGTDRAAGFRVAVGSAGTWGWGGVWGGGVRSLPRGVRRSLLRNRVRWRKVADTACRSIGCMCPAPRLPRLQGFFDRRGPGD